MKLSLLAVAISTTFLAGCSPADTPATVGNTPASYTVGGKVSGFGSSFGRLSLQLNGSEVVDISADTSYNFTTTLQETDGYDVQIIARPAGYSCEFSTANKRCDG